MNLNNKTYINNYQIIIVFVRYSDIYSKLVSSFPIISYNTFDIYICNRVIQLKITHLTLNNSEFKNLNISLSKFQIMALNIAINIALKSLRESKKKHHAVVAQKFYFCHTAKGLRLISKYIISYLKLVKFRLGDF